MTWKSTVRHLLVAVPEGEYENMVTGIQSMKGSHGFGRR